MTRFDCPAVTDVSGLAVTDVSGLAVTDVSGSCRSQSFKLTPTKLIFRSYYQAHFEEHGMTFAKQRDVCVFLVRYPGMIPGD